MNLNEYERLLVILRAYHLLSLGYAGRLLFASLLGYSDIVATVEISDVTLTASLQTVGDMLLAAGIPQSADAADDNTPRAALVLPLLERSLVRRVRKVLSECLACAH